MNDMSNAIRKFIANRKDKKIESLFKTKFLKDKDKGVNQYLIEKIDANNETLQKINNLKKDKKQTSLVFQKNKYDSLIKLINDLDVDVSNITQQYQEKIQQLNVDHEIEKWLDDNCKNADKISIATHVAKLTHSSNKGTCFYDDLKDSNDKYLTTSQIKHITADAAYENARYSPVANLLLVKDSNKKHFYQMIINNDFDALKELSNNDSYKAKNWFSYLKKAFNKNKKYSDSLSKQFYFPYRENYHLLSLLKSSSLMQEIFEKVNKKTNNIITNKKKKGKYSVEKFIFYPNKAVLSITKSFHQNSSMLNGKRSGRLFLFSAQPPTWQSQLKPPISKKSMFDNYRYQENTKENIKYLTEFLLRNENIGLSIKNPKKLKWIEKMANHIINDFLYFISTIHTLPSGWSAGKEVKLKIEHQYLLDPYRKDEKFQASKKEVDWQTIINADFSTWLNRQLKYKDKKFTPQREYSKIWKELMERELREYSQIIMANNEAEQ